MEVILAALGFPCHRRAAEVDSSCWRLVIGARIIAKTLPVSVAIMQLFLLSRKPGVAGSEV